MDDEVDLNVKDGAQNDHNRAQTDVDDEADLNVKGGAQADAGDNGLDEDNGHDVVGDGFQRLYICMAALNEGWKQGCMPILGLDGCFIKGYHTDQLLTAIGVDPNNQMYPVAYALVESECKETWFWFLKLLAVDLELNNSHGIVWITNKQKGLIYAIGDLFPNSEHRFTQMMERMRSESETTCKWLANKDPKHWSRAFFEDTALCDMLCNNICEAFNAAILKARDKPVITLMEIIRNYLMRKRSEVEK
ncbi:hypothetical protein LWI28_024235 [Acer negundo]|uniref:MULE transposase domain-containing protein n=1 Tax=Acer negundo TaxID=4023 RepID=A0AAD5IVS1_ACENE|nr:hypothetical protein LWI28_024235 [Acer negundo]